MKTSCKKIMLQLCLLSYLGLIFPITISSSYTNSGVINIYISYFILIIFFFFALNMWLRRYRVTSKPLNVIMLVYVLLGCLYIFETIIRIIHGKPFYKSMQMMVETYLPISVFCLIISNKFNTKQMLHVLMIALTVFNIYILYKIISESTFRPNIIFNTNVIVILAISGIFLNAFYMEYIHVNIKQIFLLFFNLCYSIIIILFSGSRTGIVEGAACIFIIWWISKKRVLFTSATLLGLILSSLIFITNFGYSQSLLDRATNIGVFSESSKNMQQSENQTFKAINDKLNEAVSNGNAQQILVANDMSRILLWNLAGDEIKKSPILGTGEVSFLVRSSEPKQTAHNFILEYTLIYGITGLLLWIAFTLILLACYYRQIVFYNRKTRPWMILYAIFVCAFSCMQPTLSTLQVTLFFWGIMGVFYAEPQRTIK